VAISRAYIGRGENEVMTRLAHTDAPMTVEEFLAFAMTRPDKEKWELIEGEPILNAAPAYLHQRIVGNLVAELGLIERQRKSHWAAMPGIGARLSDISMPIPDVMVRPRDLLNGSVCDDMIVAFEVLSPSTATRDLRWKRHAYATLPSLWHYVVVAQDHTELFAYDRAANFAERRIAAIEEAIELAALGLALPLADIYRDTGLIA
jgi:Uma2 family endonuclease